MLKIVWGGIFREDVPVDEARSHWANIHGPLGLKAAGMAGYIQSHVVGALVNRDIVDRPVFLNGYSVQWWESRDAFSRAMKSPEWDAVRVDDATIFNSTASRGTSAVLEPRVIKDGPRLPFKVVWFARFLPHIDPQEASDRWLSHGAIAIESGEVGRYIQNLVMAGIGKDGSISTDNKVIYDGFSECWFADRAAYERAVGSEPWARLEQDAATLFDMEAMSDGMSAVLEERVIRDPES
jgi:hypothetical protein